MIFYNLIGIMKNKYLLSFILGLPLSVASYAQDFWEHGGVTYQYDKTKPEWTPETMGEPTFSDGFEISSFTFDEDEIAEDGTVSLTLKAKGTLYVDGRELTFYPTYYSGDPRANDYSFGTYVDEEDEETTTFSIKAKIKSNNWELTDPYRKYWLAYRIAKRYEAAHSDDVIIVRGSDIPASVKKDASGMNISHVKYENELFYFYDPDNEDYYPVWTCSVKHKNMYTAKFKLNYIHSKTTYVLTEVPAGVFEGNSKPVDIKIGSSVNTINASFGDANVKSFSVDAANPKYTTILGSDVLCEKNANGVADKVIGVAVDAGSITLPATIGTIAAKSIYPTATGVKLSSTNESLVCNDNTFVGWKANEDEDATSLKIASSWSAPTVSTLAVPEDYMQESSKSNGTATSKGKAGKTTYHVFSAADAKAYLTSLAGNKSICYVDFTNSKIDATDLGAIDMSAINANCLLFLPEGVTATGNNIVVNGGNARTCASLVLTRTSGIPFANPYQFTATNVTVGGFTIGTNMLGLMLPFEYSNEDVKLAVFTGYSDGALNFNNKITTIPANTPFVTRKADGADDQSVTATNVVVAATPVTDETSFQSGWAMNGTYQTVTNSSSTSYSIYGFSQNQLKRVAGATFKPFSSYFVSNNSNVAQAKMRFAMEDVDDATGVEDVESFASTTIGNGVIYVSAANTKVVVASVNGTVLYNDVVNGTVAVDVRPGVYVVNGKKVIVNK